jgi:N6-adenosine-specific RNA methylase IME4
VRDRITQLYGDVPKIELFAREKFDGWDSWGLAITKSGEYNNK